LADRKRQAGGAEPETSGALSKIQGDLFGPSVGLPEGLSYREDFVAEDEEQTLLAAVQPLPFKQFEFVGGYRGKRRVVSFGWRYDFNAAKLQKADVLPSFLLSLRARAAEFAGLPEDAFEHALITEYAPGAGIGWHKDRPVFDRVVGISLLSLCTLRFRRKVAERKWERMSLAAWPRSAYVLTGPSRSEWEHSIPPVESLRYSITFRSMRG
jgi:alkylated DNA repair dioxygenase AlkB